MRGENKRRREEKKSHKTKSKIVNKMAIRPYISIITLNVNGLNARTKRYRLAEWNTYFSFRDTYKQKVRGWKKIFHAS